MRFAISTIAVTSRLPIKIPSSGRNNSIEKKRGRVVRCAQAREERSLSPLPPQKTITNANPLKTPSSSVSRITTASTPLIEESSSPGPLILQRMSQQDAVILISAATLGFSFLAGDVIFWHSLRWLDIGIHLFIRNHVSVELHDFARHTMSNTPIVLGWCGWAAAATALVYNSNIKASNEDSSVSTGVRHFLLSIAMYLLGGGTILHGDPWLVKIIKEVFQRSRPTELSSTYSFPSGHTTSATFVIGTLLFIILPAMLEAYSMKQANGTGVAHASRKSTIRSSTDSIKSIESDGKLEHSGRSALEILQQNRILLWIFCVATTASGRVVGDVHWSTDVMAGACLGMGLVAVTVLACGLSDVLVGQKEREARR